MFKGINQKLRAINKLFFFKDIDSHYIINILGVVIKIKHHTQHEYPLATSIGINQSEKRNPRIIVSLTSYTKRINTVHITINSLLRQTVKPDKLILWLTDEEFPNREEDLPEDLLKLKDLGLTIDWCEPIKNYKKNIPTFRKYPDDIVITVDDDVYYKPDLIESLYAEYLKNPSNIYAKRIKRVKFVNNKLIRLSCREHCFEKTQEPGFLSILNGAGGILYPPHSLCKEAVNGSKKILNDDYFMWAMAVLNNTKIAEVSGYDESLNTIDEALAYSFSKDETNYRSWTDITLEEYPELINIIGGKK